MPANLGTQPRQAAQLPRSGEGAQAAPGDSWNRCPGAQQPAPGMLGPSTPRGAGCQPGPLRKGLISKVLTAPPLLTSRLDRRVRAALATGTGTALALG